jgi:serine-type D-Ala-D-Ala carboxypeptidase (penicillin-binding protein 5/6)
VKTKRRTKPTVRRGLAALVPAIIIVVYLIWAFFQPLAAVSPVSALKPVAPVRTTPNIAWSAYGEQAVGVVGSGVWATHGDQKSLPMASIAKVMASLAVLQKYPLTLGDQGPNIPITDVDVTMYNDYISEDQSVVKVQAGEQISEYQALQALLIPSANNMATTLTNWAFGSQQNYMTYANNYARNLGMIGTNFADSSGFSPQTVGTPSDLVLLGEAAMQNPVIKQIVNQYTATLPVQGQVTNYNTNIRPGSNTGLNGVKTGNTDQSGGSLLWSSDYDEDTTIVGIILNAPNLGVAVRESPAVAQSVRANLQKDTVINAGQRVASYNLPWGGSVNAVAKKDVSVVNWKGTRLPVETKLDALKKGDKGKTVGAVWFNYNNALHSTDVVLEKNFSQPAFWWRVTHPRRD